MPSALCLLMWKKSSQNPKSLEFQLGVVGVFNLSGKHLNVSIMGWPSLLFPRQNDSDGYFFSKFIKL